MGSFPGTLPRRCIVAEGMLSFSFVIRWQQLFVGDRELHPSAQNIQSFLVPFDPSVTRYGNGILPEWLTSDVNQRQKESPVSWAHLYKGRGLRPQYRIIDFRDHRIIPRESIVVLGTRGKRCFNLVIRGVLQFHSLSSETIYALYQEVYPPTPHFRSIRLTISSELWTLSPFRDCGVGG
jgi:hypothetical protein